MFPAISSHTIFHHILHARVLPFSQAGSTQSLALQYALPFPLDVSTRFPFFVVSLPLSLYHGALQDFTFYYDLLPRQHFSTVFFGIVVLAMMAIVRAIVKVKIKVSFSIPYSQHLRSFMPSCVDHLHPKWISSTQGSIMKELDVKLVARSHTL